MAKSNVPLGRSSSSSMLLLSLSLVFFFTVRPSFSSVDRLILNINGTEDVIEEVCRHTHDADYCVTALKSDPRSSQADLPGLANIAIGLAYQMAQDANLYALSIVRNGTSPELQQRYLLCSERLLDAREELREARDDLKSNDYIDVSSAALEATDEVQTCRDQFQMPPSEPSQLPQMITKVITLTTAVFFISGRLIKNI